MSNAVHSVFDDSRLHGCRFHLGQSWWTLGLSEDYKAKGTPISEWLLLFFGLSLLSPDDVITAFTDEIIPSCLLMTVAKGSLIRLYC